MKKLLPIVLGLIAGTSLTYANPQNGVPNNKNKANYTLQILHVSDLEGGGGAVVKAPAFTAITEYLENQYANTVIISSGDNFIPGPFFSASAEAPIQDSLRDILSDFYGTNLDQLTGAAGRIDISIMNIIGFDASAFGNHEFDATVSAVEGTILSEGGTDITWMGSQFPYLSANLDFSASSLSSRATTSVLPQSDFITDLNSPATASNTKKIAPATVITRNGEQIGVIGATTQILSTISSPGDVTVVGNPTTDDMTQLAGVLQPYIDSLTNMGVNKIILTSHLQQISLEQQLAGLLSGVDIIIAGGSDFLLADATDALHPGDVAAGTYPLQTTNANNEPVMIVNTAGEYSYVGRLVITFDDNGIILPNTLNATESGIYATMPSVITSLYGTTDPYTINGSKAWYATRLASAIADLVVSKDGNTFGKTNHFLEGRRTHVRTEETNLGNLTADANLWIARKYDSEVAVSIKNGGGIRSEIGYINQITSTLLPPQPNTVAGKDSLEVSQLDIENALRFNNLLTVAETTPAGLKALLEHGIENWDGIATQGRMPQIGGMEFSFDPTQAAGSRIVNMAIVDDNGNAIDSVVVNGAIYGDASRIIKMVSLNFLVHNDGDGYPFSTEVSNTVDLDNTNINHTQQVSFADLGSEQNALAEYLVEKFSTTPFDGEETSPEFDNRIQILSLRADSVLNNNSIGLHDNFRTSKVALYPNPTTGKLFINHLEGEFITKVEIFNTIGAKVFERNNLKNQNLSLDLNLNAGSYVVIVSTKNANAQTQLMIVE